MSIIEKLNRMRMGTWSLKSQLAIYFVPISVLPAVFISYYATYLFEKNTGDILARHASTERDALLAELDAVESDLLAEARALSSSRDLVMATSRRSKYEIQTQLESRRINMEKRVFAPNGDFLASRKGPGVIDEIPYLSKDGLKRVLNRGETVDRYFADDSSGFITVIRRLIKDRDKTVGILEEEFRFGARELVGISTRRGVDVVLLSRDFTKVTASFALGNDALRSFSKMAFWSKERQGNAVVYVPLGDARFAAFLYDLPFSYGKNRNWGYLAIFLPMATIDATVGSVRTALFYLAVFFMLTAVVLIIVFSRQIVRPIETLVLAMKKMKSGRVEELHAVDSTYELEYLVRSFNDMARNVTAAKKTLEQKLGELRRANLSITTAQTQLVQSAKMASLGQVVAGVAHELNNPIAFIYSNLHHLNGYIPKIKQLIEAYRKINASEKDRKAMNELEASIEIDYLLKDIGELTHSCVEGANRVKDIVLGLRTFSRMDESQFRLVDIREGLKATLKLLESQFKGHITVHEQWNELPLIECNMSQLNQVWLNLLSNAEQAIGESKGKGDIWIRAASIQPQLISENGQPKANVPPKAIYVEIEDNGCGISKEAMEKIFDPFFTTKKVGEGTGLGLSISYGLVQKHQGTITVKSEIGKGTTFHVELPVRQESKHS